MAVVTEKSWTHETAGIDTGQQRPAASDGVADRCLEWILVFAIATSLFGLVLALASVFHAAQVLLGGLLLTGWFMYRMRHSRAFPGPKARWVHLLLLLLVTLFFRLPAYNYVMGGQDEGLYTNMAQHIEHTGGIKVRDEVERKVQGSPALKNYMEDNYYIPGAFVAGVYARSPNGKIQFQFYHLFPVWMALFAGLFGSAAGVYALTFLAVVSVCFFYRLALLLTESHRAALMAGALLALNPLHAFFSKFPVTEVPALAFSLIGFALLAGYWSAQPSQRRTGWLILAALSFGCLFTTRISGFMYVPFFILLAMAALVFDSEPSRRVALQRWAIWTLIAYLISVLYGVAFSHYYATDIYRLSFHPVLGRHWEGMLAILVGIVLLCWAALAMWTQNSRFRVRSVAWINGWRGWTPTLLVLLALVFGSLKIYRLGWTTHYANGGLGEFWHLAGKGWQAASASSLWALVVYLGPLLAIALLLGLLQRQSDPRVAFMRWFVAGFFIYIAVLQWVLPYGPYYARYLLSELVPYGMLLVVCAWAGMRASRTRTMVTVILVLSLVYSGILSAMQIGKNEQDGARESLARLVSPIGPDDLVLLQKSDDPMGVLKTPLMYTFHLKAADAGEGSLSDPAYLLQMDSLYDGLFLISSKEVAPQGFTRVESVRFKIVSFRHDHSFPHKLVVSENKQLFLYRFGGAEPSPNRSAASSH
ncbi:MAG: phospholipid carrier-dependent glycosyltransferase [Rhodanobacteraceae bacterium]